MMSRAVSRGALIVFEGCDRCGKTTQCKKLVEALNADGIPAKMWRFPDRETSIGRVINDYLEQKAELEDHAIHLLFTANRWEAVPKMTELLNQGTTLIVDRYSFSGVAFTAAKQGIDLRWCQRPEVGLPAPDAVLYMTLDAEEAARRDSFGKERYECTEFQNKVAKNYELLKQTNWKTINAGQSIETLHDQIKTLAKQILKEAQHKQLGQLWTELDSSTDRVTPSEAPPTKRHCSDGPQTNGIATSIGSSNEVS